jgi:Domain of unknown function (DUF1844)
MEDQEDKRGFKVQDRRRFSAEGEVKADGEESSDRAEAPSPLRSQAASPPKPEPVAKPAASQAFGASERPEPGHGAPAAELTFAAFVWSLSEQALAALGEIPDPMSGKVTHDLVMAQQMIDIIIMLRDKTRGNLDQHEQTLVQEILSTLQMKYVELARHPGR